MEVYQILRLKYKTPFTPQILKTDRNRRTVYSKKLMVNLKNPSAHYFNSANTFSQKKIYHVKNCMLGVTCLRSHLKICIQHLHADREDVTNVIINYSPGPSTFQTKQRFNISKFLPDSTSTIGKFHLLSFGFRGISYYTNR